MTAEVRRPWAVAQFVVVVERWPWAIAIVVTTEVRWPWTVSRVMSAEVRRSETIARTMVKGTTVAMVTTVPQMLTMREMMRDTFSSITTS